MPTPSQIFSACLTLLNSERPKLHTILAFLSAVGLNWCHKISKVSVVMLGLRGHVMYDYLAVGNKGEQVT